MHVYHRPGGGRPISTAVAARRLGSLWRRHSRAEETEEDVDGEKKSDNRRS